MGRSILTAPKRENEKDKAAAEAEREGENHVDNGQGNNGLMVIENSLNNHCSPLTSLNDCDVKFNCVPI